MPTDLEREVRNKIASQREILKKTSISLEEIESKREDPLYQKSASHRHVFIYEDAQNKLTPSGLVVIVMNQLKEDIKRQRQEKAEETR